jgi:hypothetical protein
LQGRLLLLTCWLSQVVQAVVVQMLVEREVVVVVRAVIVQAQPNP